MKKLIISIVVGLALSANANNFYYEYGKKVKVSKLSQTRDMKDNKVSYYMTAHGHKVGVTDELIVKCEPNIECTEILKKYNLTQVSKLSNTLFLIKLVNNENIFEYSQKLHQDSHIKFAHPNFIKERKRR